MKQIEAFVDSIYHTVGGNKKRIQESKEEIKNHLLEAVLDLQSNGKTEQEAIELAIQRFGGENELRSVVNQIFRVQRIFAKRLLMIAIGFLIVGISLFGISIWKAESYSDQQSEVATQIFNLLQGETQITSSMKKRIKNLADHTDHIRDIQIYNVRDIPTEKAYKDVFDYVYDKHTKPEYTYSKNVWNPNWLHADFHNYGNGDDKWYVNMQVRYFNDLITLAFLGGPVVYWTLFTIWATINAYHHKRLHVGWVMLFAGTNVIGYLIFYLVGRRRDI